MVLSKNMVPPTSQRRWQVHPPCSRWKWWCQWGVKPLFIFVGPIRLVWVAHGSPISLAQVPWHGHFGKLTQGFIYIFPNINSGWINPGGLFGWFPRDSGRVIGYYNGTAPINLPSVSVIQRWPYPSAFVAPISKHILAPTLWPDACSASSLINAWWVMLRTLGMMAMSTAMPTGFNAKCQICQTYKYWLNILNMSETWFLHNRIVWTTSLNPVELQLPLKVCQNDGSCDSWLWPLSVEKRVVGDSFRHPNAYRERERSHMAPGGKHHRGRVVPNGGTTEPPFPQKSA